MEKAEHILKHAERRCVDKGLRLTAKRKQVLSILLKSETALSAYDIINDYELHYGYTIAAMTVYRILDFLEKEHLAHRLMLANKYIACSQITCNHDHKASQFLICSHCQRVEEIHIHQKTIQALDNHVKNAGYIRINPQLEMSCLCDQCSTTSSYI